MSVLEHTGISLAHPTSVRVFVQHMVKDYASWRKSYDASRRTEFALACERGRRHTPAALLFSDRLVNRVWITIANRKLAG